MTLSTLFYLSGLCALHIVRKLNVNEFDTMEANKVNDDIRRTNTHMHTHTHIHRYARIPLLGTWDGAWCNGWHERRNNLLNGHIALRHICMHYKPRGKLLGLIPRIAFAVDRFSKYRHTVQDLVLASNRTSRGNRNWAHSFCYWLLLIKIRWLFPIAC